MATALEGAPQSHYEPDQGPLDPLELHRFQITPESMQMLKGVRNELGVMQQEKPWIEGVGFFGSRTRGQEGEYSDLDLIVFYNSDSDLSHVVVESDAERLIEPVGASVNLHPNIDGYVVNTVFKYDISVANLRSDIDNLEELIAHTKAEQKDIGMISPPELVDMANTLDIKLPDLHYLFMLSVGDGAYKARKFVLDELAKSPNGDEGIAYISNILNYQDRDRARIKRPDTPDYSNYPASVEAARKYFRTKDYSESDFPELSEEELLQRKKAAVDRLWEGRDDPTKASRLGRVFSRLRKS